MLVQVQVLAVARRFGLAGAAAVLMLVQVLALDRRFALQVLLPCRCWCWIGPRFERNPEDVAARVTVTGACVLRDPSAVAATLRQDDQTGSQQRVGDRRRSDFVAGAVNCHFWTCRSFPDFVAGTALCEPWIRSECRFCGRHNTL